MMACEKTSKLIQEMVDHHGCDMWPERFKQMADESDKELNALVAKVDQLEAKAQELERREKGCKVEYSHYEVLAYGTKDFYTCSECKQDVVMDGSDYCPSCGYRIDWNGESEAGDV